METALITGASEGIGRELARIMARSRFNLVLTARREHELLELKTELEAEYGVKVRVIPKDLSEIESVKDIYAELKKDNVAVDILVNNAGFGDYGLFIESDLEKNYRMIELNVAALTYLAHLFGKEMADRGHGRILNVASTAAFQPGPLMAVYYATKAYVLSFSEALANELKDKGVSVTALCPGPTKSGFQRRASVKNVLLFNNRSVATAESVASYAFRAMMKGKVVAVHGIFNSIVAGSIRFFPRKLVTASVRYIQKTTKQEL
ncbi:MAG: SDR family oxidoreductase [Ignavibacteria bacterium]|nr:SDR family oxidoreductase [Ignavibacteria bacterium]MCU7504482.1 SDR family oxidoreductase [Ignavibacteria bacterium]MCU7517939.1 SDR family oxidoreductase [Ignavibacteria bacterium]